MPCSFSILPFVDGYLTYTHLYSIVQPKQFLIVTKCFIISTVDQIKSSSINTNFIKFPSDIELVQFILKVTSFFFVTNFITFGWLDYGQMGCGAAKATQTTDGPQNITNEKNKILDSVAQEDHKNVADRPPTPGKRGFSNFILF